MFSLRSSGEFQYPNAIQAPQHAAAAMATNMQRVHLKEIAGYELAVKPPATARGEAEPVHRGFAAPSPLSFTTSLTSPPPRGTLGSGRTPDALP